MENKVTDCYIWLHPVSSKNVNSLALNVSVPLTLPSGENCLLCKSLLEETYLDVFKTVQALTWNCKFLSTSLTTDKLLFMLSDKEKSCISGLSIHRSHIGPATSGCLNPRMPGAGLGGDCTMSFYIRHLNTSGFLHICGGEERKGGVLPSIEGVFP